MKPANDNASVLICLYTLHESNMSAVDNILNLPDADHVAAMEAKWHLMKGYENLLAAIKGVAICD